MNFLSTHTSKSMIHTSAFRFMTTVIETDSLKRVLTTILHIHQTQHDNCQFWPVQLRMSCVLLCAGAPNFCLCEWTTGYCVSLFVQLLSTQIRSVQHLYQLWDDSCDLTDVMTSLRWWERCLLTTQVMWSTGCSSLGDTTSKQASLTYAHTETWASNHSKKNSA